MVTRLGIVVLATATFWMSACDSLKGASSSSPAEYKITEDGGAYVSDVSTYESIGQKTATRGQKYKIVSLAGVGAPTHFLVANITQYYGNKKGDESEGELLFIKDGSATYDCKKFITDLKTTVSNDDIPNVTCKFEVIGTIPLASKAALKND